MKTRIFLAACAVLISLSVFAQTPQADYKVVPLPQAIAQQKGQPFVLKDHVTISCAGNDAALKRNAEFLRDYIKEYTGIQLDIVEKKGDIQLSLTKKIKQQEGYCIIVNNKHIVLSGQTPAGVFYAIQTLRKSLQPNVSQIELPAVIISDAPRFGYRGMHLDCARHFFPVKFVKQYIDMIAMHNINVFHWHLTDDQGWRIEIKKYPRLTEIGSKRDMTTIGHNVDIYDSIPYGGYYTQEEAREIVRYAAERYITVIPEIDMPGHMQGALAAYPELGCTGGPYKVWRMWGISNDVLCLGNEKIYEFCQNVLKEIMDIFPSKYINFGGDETPTVRWEKCPKCLALSQREGIDVKHLQNYFTERMEKFIMENGRRAVGWDEVLGAKNLSTNTVILDWRDVAAGEKAALRGNDVIMSPTSHLYFDYYQTAEKESQWEQEWAQPLLIGGHLPIEKTYSFEPCPDTLPAAAKSHIIGVQANLWTEYIPYPSLAQYQVLPRMAALAEIQWMQPEKKNFESFRERSKSLRRLYDACHLSYNKRLWGENDCLQP
ncbi:MAG: beta-N-acetylhexosaminidase [Prevotella sp.]|jgi:hexosaminidase